MSFSSGFQLRVIKGQGEKDRVIRLDGEEFTLGRARQGQRPGSGEILFRESSVSRLHASLTWKEGKGCFQLTHKSATNPTMVNGKPAKKILLEPGDRVQMGLLLLILEEAPQGRRSTSTSAGGKDQKPNAALINGTKEKAPSLQEEREKRRTRPAFEWRPPEERQARPGSNRPPS